MIAPMMNLRDFLKEIGDDTAAKLIGVKPRTISAWRRGERFPRPEQAARILRASNGRVDYEGIYSVSGPAPDAPDNRAA